MPEVRSSAEVVRGGYDAWNTGDLETFLEFVHPDVLWTTSGLFPGLRPTYSGPEGMREFWEAFQEPWESFQIAIEEMFELDSDSLLIKVRFHVKGRETIELERRITNHLVIRDEKLYRFKGYDRWEEALADLGIDDPGSEPASSPE
jgi:ketosteroid isomerase-like protein